VNSGQTRLARVPRHPQPHENHGANEILIHLDILEYTALLVDG